MTRFVRLAPVLAISSLGMSACISTPKIVVGNPPAHLRPDAVPVPITYSSNRNDGAKIRDFEIDCSNTFTKTSFFSTPDPCSKDTSDDFEILRGGVEAWSVECSSRLDPERSPAVHLVCTFAPEDVSFAPMSLALVASSSAALHGMYLAKSRWIVKARAAGGAQRPWFVKGKTGGFGVYRTGSPQPVVFIGSTSSRGVRRTTAFIAPELSDDEHAELIPLIFTLMQMRDARTAPDEKKEPAFTVDGEDPLSNEWTVEDGQLKPPSALGLLAGADACEYTQSEATPLPSPKADASAHERHALELLRLGYTQAARALWWMLND